MALNIVCHSKISKRNVNLKPHVGCVNRGKRIQSIGWQQWVSSSNFLIMQDM